MSNSSGKVFESSRGADFFFFFYERSPHIPEQPKPQTTPSQNAPSMVEAPHKHNRTWNKYVRFNSLASFIIRGMLSEKLLQWSISLGTKLIDLRILNKKRTSKSSSNVNAKRRVFKDPGNICIQATPNFLAKKLEQ